MLMMGRGYEGIGNDGGRFDGFDMMGSFQQNL
jgi:hypothetical protein